MKFKKGDKVNFTDFVGGGIIKEVLGNDTYLIEGDEGIEMRVHKNEIVKEFNPFKALPVFRKPVDDVNPASKPSTPAKPENQEPDWNAAGKPQIRKEKDSKSKPEPKSAEDWVKKNFEDEKRRMDSDDSLWQADAKKSIPKVRNKEYIQNTSQIKSEDSPGNNAKKSAPARQTAIPEIDLHFDEIEAASWNLPADERLQYQLRYFQQKLEELIAAKVRKFVVIHGVGEGILRKEVRYILQSYPQVHYYDASWKEFGRGATMVEIRY